VKTRASAYRAAVILLPWADESRGWDEALC
jgi:hypothetical protein